MESSIEDNYDKIYSCVNLEVKNFKKYIKEKFNFKNKVILIRRHENETAVISWNKSTFYKPRDILRFRVHGLFSIEKIEVDRLYREDDDLA